MSSSRESLGAKKTLLHWVEEQAQQQQQEQRQYSSLAALASPWLERTIAAGMHSTRQHVGSNGLRRVTGLSESE